VVISAYQGTKLPKGLARSLPLTAEVWCCSGDPRYLQFTVHGLKIRENFGMTCSLIPVFFNFIFSPYLRAAFHQLWGCAVALA
jgi:hypothetical protein